MRPVRRAGTGARRPDPHRRDHRWPARDVRAIGGHGVRWSRRLVVTAPGGHGAWWSRPDAVPARVRRCVRPAGGRPSGSPAADGRRCAGRRTGARRAPRPAASGPRTGGAPPPGSRRTAGRPGARPASAGCGSAPAASTRIRRPAGGLAWSPSASRPLVAGPRLPGPPGPYAPAAPPQAAWPRVIAPGATPSRPGPQPASPPGFLPMRSKSWRVAGRPSWNPVRTKSSPVVALSAQFVSTRARAVNVGSAITW